MKTLRSIIAVSLLSVASASNASLFKLINPPQNGPTVKTVVTSETVVSVFDEFDINGQYPTNPLEHFVHDIVYGHHPLTNTTLPVTPEISAIPIPAAVWLFASGLIGLVAVSRRN